MYPWDKPHLVMVHDSFCIYWILLANTLRLLFLFRELPRRPSLGSTAAGDAVFQLTFVSDVLTSPSSLKDIFIGYWTLSWQFFSFSTWKLLCLSDLSIFCWNICCYLNNFSPIGKVCFLSHCFQGLLSFSVQKFNCLRVLLRISLSLSCLLRCLLRLLSL